MASLLCAYLLLILPLCASDEAPTWVDGLAARVNNSIITVGDVMMQVYAQQRKWSEKLSPDERNAKIQQAYRDSLNSQIETKLILEAYEKQENKIPDAFVDERITAIIEENYGGDRSRLTEDLNNDKTTFLEWKKSVREQIIVSSMRQTFVRQKVHIAPEAMKAWYEGHTHEFMTPLLVKLDALIFKGTNAADSNALTRAQAALEQLRAGTNIAALSTAKDKGQWGWMQPDALQPEFAAAVVKLPTGGFSDIIPRGNDLYIFGVADRKESRPQSFDEVRDLIENRLTRDESAAIHAAWVARLKQSAAIEIRVPELPQ